MEKELKVYFVCPDHNPRFFRVQEMKSVLVSEEHFKAGSYHVPNCQECGRPMIPEFQNDIEEILFDAGISSDQVGKSEEDIRDRLFLKESEIIVYSDTDNKYSRMIGGKLYLCVSFQKGGYTTQPIHIQQDFTDCEKIEGFVRNYFDAMEKESEIPEIEGSWLLLL